ncbi:hypothetical protein NL676_019862 [Syzygium grande]|nr:hypothetical protein NL676_019862 [Syzygium grande]
MEPVTVAGTVAKPFAEKYYQLLDAIVQDLGNLSSPAGVASGVLVLVKGVLDFIPLDDVRQAVNFSQCVGLNDIKCDFSVNIQ